MNLEMEKKKLEKLKVEAAKAEMEYKILERLEDIERLKKNINVQEEAIKRIVDEMSSMEE